MLEEYYKAIPVWLQSQPLVSCLCLGKCESVQESQEELPWVWFISLWGNGMKRGNLLCLVGSEIEKGEKGSSWGNEDPMWENCEPPAHGLQNLGRALFKSSQVMASLQTCSSRVNPSPQAGPAPHAQGAVGMKCGWGRSMLKRGTSFSDSLGLSVTSGESHLCWACTDKMNLFGFMADQNEETAEISEPPEHVSLADASAEKATKGSDTDLEDEGECFLTICPH